MKYTWKDSNFNSTNCIQVAKEVGLRTSKFIIADTFDNTLPNYNNIIRIDRYSTEITKFKKILSGIIQIVSDETQEGLDESEIDIIASTMESLFDGIQMDEKPYFSFIKRYENVLRAFNSLIKLVQTYDDVIETRNSELDNQCGLIIRRSELLNNIKGNKFDVVLGYIARNTGLQVCQKSKSLQQRNDGCIYVSNRASAKKKSEDIVNSVAFHYMAYYKGMIDNEMANTIASILIRAINDENELTKGLWIKNEEETLNNLAFAVSVMTSNLI